MNISNRPIGKTGLAVSSFGLGTAFLGENFKPTSEQAAFETINYALSKGINFIDTAPLYDAGVCEQRLGLALNAIPRDSYVLATKVGRLVQPDRSVTFDYSRDGVLRSIEASLKRLQLDRLDILHIHDPDNHYREALDTAFSTLAELRSQGVIRAIGAGMNQWQMLADFARNADFDCFLLAGRYTLLEQGALAEFLPLCAARQISVFLGGVYNSGILATGGRPGAIYNYEAAPPEVLERVNKIEAVCARYDVPLNVAALQFPAAHPAVTALIVGAQSPAEIEANLQAFQHPIPSQLWADLKTEGLLDEAAPVP